MSGADDHPPGVHHHHPRRHNHSSDLAPVNFTRAFAVGISLNLLFVIIEAGFGAISGSLALIADAGHNLSDVMTLLLAWGAMAMAKQSATARHTFGLKKATILASLGSALFLCAAIGVIVWEAIGRLRNPVPVDGMTIMLVAAIGVVINTATALLFMAGRKNDLNIRGAFLHMAADAAVSAGVVVSGVLITFTGWNILDPVISVVIALVILVAGWGLLRDSLHLSMAGVPTGIDAGAVLAYLRSLPEVEHVYDLHVWAASTTENVLTAKIIMHSGGSDQFLRDTATYLRHHFAIHHSTIQVERESVAASASGNEQGRCWPGRTSP